MQDFNYNNYRKNNPLLKEVVNTGNELINYLESAVQKCFDRGGNGQNLIDNTGELAAFLDQYMETARRTGPEEGGFYTQATAVAFKKLIDAMLNDEIKNNNASKYGDGGSDDDDTYDEFTDTINNIK